jgi:UDP-2-acetamido-2,6-beta-L-arabino-hexul-4-ose reductase
MKIAVTGAEGFLGRQLRVRALATGEHDVLALDRAALADSGRLAEVLGRADAVIHLAGVNRDRPAVVEQGNVDLARILVSGLTATRRPLPVIYADSICSGSATPYGRGKQAAAEALAQWAGRVGAPFTAIRLPNLFGEWGRPFYNSVVATFCHQLAIGDRPTVVEDREIELLPAAVAVRALLHAASSPIPDAVDLGGARTVTVSGLLDRLRDLHDTYSQDRLPALADPWERSLFNAYRSYLPPAWYPRSLGSHRDLRGNFVEVVRSGGGSSQTSFSTTAPGVTRGNHFHLRKLERFAVLSGRAAIAVRPVLSTTTTVYRVDGAEPTYVDMPTMCTHNITNVGDGELLTIFWTDETYDPTDPDTYMEPV